MHLICKREVPEGQGGGGGRGGVRWGVTWKGSMEG